MLHDNAKGFMGTHFNLGRGTVKEYLTLVAGYKGTPIINTVPILQGTVPE